MINKDIKKILSLIFITIIITFLLIFILMWISICLSGDTKRLNEFWNINIPSPSEKVVKLDSEPDFLGDGESFITYKYSDNDFNKIRKSNIGKFIDYKNIDTIKQDIEDFKNKILNINNSKGDLERKKQVEKVFKENPIKISIEDRYLYLKKEDNSELFLVIKSNERKVYILQIIM
ncbi:hypothetical protein IR152_02605 [Clostridioides sp. ES-S-0108-01]|uniref:hypothetical protein n=1 Tax=Clostridioides sp. ES-S-0108-01 TaxID=2770773 RepID=UPI001D0CADF4|nr:hypothetical protein [Clostridioides sp. ES-S-0108-01]UDN51267.1 hypothetical protein JJC16_00575 [Clostridioides sp. ES-S-0107-01]